MSDFNPFSPPQTSAQAQSDFESQHRKMLINFRQQMTALGALWLIFGTIGAAATVLLVRASPQEFGGDYKGMLLLFLGVVAAIYFILGVAACFKQVWAVYVGLGLTYIGLLGQLTRFNVCGLAISVAVILQGHRVLGFANTLRKAGVPLDTKV